MHVLNNLGKCPKINSDLRKTSPEVTLQLRNFVKSADQQANNMSGNGIDLSPMGHLLLIETKRLVLTLLRCMKNCKSLTELLEKPITPAMEDAYQQTMIMDLSDPAASQDNVFKSNADLSE